MTSPSITERTPVDIGTLAKVPLFSVLTAEQIRVLDTRCIWCRVDGGELVRATPRRALSVGEDIILHAVGSLGPVNAPIVAVVSRGEHHEVVLGVYVSLGAQVPASVDHHGSAEQAFRSDELVATEADVVDDARH